jgi:hypothetical protein
LVNINKQNIKTNKDDIATLNTDFTALDARVVTLETYQTNTLMPYMVRDVLSATVTLMLSLSCVAEVMSAVLPLTIGVRAFTAPTDESAFAVLAEILLT